MMMSTLPNGPKILILVAAILLGIAPGLAETPKHRKAVKPKAKQEQPAPAAPLPMPDAPPPQATLAQMPATPAQVTYRDNQLAITARNSTMGQILNAVRKQTGAAMDFPSNAGERVVGQFGPGPARDVLASLLAGSDFNYILLGSAANPSGLDRVIVTTKPSGPDSTPAQPNAGQAQVQFPGGSDENGVDNS